MVVKVSTAEMAKLYEDGLSLEAIGQKFGMTKQGVRDRFIKAGIERHKTKYKQINREHLETLYLEQRMSIDRIADVFSTTRGLIRRALKFHNISHRPALNLGGYKVDFLRSLKIGEMRIIEWRNEKRYIHLHDTANRIGIKISIRGRGGNNFEVTRVA